MNIQILKKNSKKGFKKLLGINRDTTPSHIAKLKASINELGMLQAIIVADLTFVTGKKETYIIEGQHKYEACMALGIEIPYTTIQIDDYAQLIRTMALLNSSSKSWSLVDYVLAWSSLHNDYKRLLVLSNQYKVELSVVASILSGKSVNIGAVINRTIKKGDFAITVSEENATKYLQFYADFISKAPKLTRVCEKRMNTAYMVVMYNLADKYNHNSLLGYVTKKREDLINACETNDFTAFFDKYVDFINANKA